LSEGFAETLRERIVEFSVDKRLLRLSVAEKWFEGMLWWHRLINEVVAEILPDLLSMLSPNEIDLDDPIATARNIVAKFRALLERCRG